MFLDYWSVLLQYRFKLKFLRHRYSNYHILAEMQTILILLFFSIQEMK